MSKERGYGRNMEKYEFDISSLYVRYFVVIHTYTHYIHHPHVHTTVHLFSISFRFRNTFYSYFLLFFYHPFRCLSLLVFFYFSLSP